MRRRGSIPLRGRRGARAIALKILYFADMRHLSSDEAITLFYEGFDTHRATSRDDREDIDLPQDRDAWDRSFMEFIVRGVRGHQAALDRLIEQVSENWRVYRMSIVDRNIIRIALFEILYCHEIPPKVSINEAIELGKIFGDRDSASFINGILDRIYQTVVTVHGAMLEQQTS